MRTGRLLSKILKTFVSSWWCHHNDVISENLFLTKKDVTFQWRHCRLNFLILIIKIL